MAPLEDFESILKEVVQAKRLSASKMGKLTEIALKSMDNDTQLVSILYRTHKSLPPAAKVSSLYVFDALSRAARHQATKQSISGHIISTTGTSSTFLLKVEGVLEGLFQDMIMVGSTEAKEKTKKILDIWVKGNTFPSKILSRLMDVVQEKETEKVSVPEMKSLTTSDPRTNSQLVVSTPTPPTSAGSPPAPAMDPQATLLALLAQAANASAASNQAQTLPNTGFVPPGLDVKQLAVLQQLALAQTQTASSAAPPILSQSAPAAVPATSGSTLYPAPSVRDEPFNILRKDRRYERRHSPERANGHDQSDDRIHSRGTLRGVPRGRGRGDFRGNRWDDRDRDRYVGRDKDWTPAPHRGQRSRSRSPPSRQAGRRDVRPYSPPRRPSFSPIAPRGQKNSDPGVHEAETDEFGREIRPRSPDGDVPPISKSEPIQSPSPPPPSSQPTSSHTDPMTVDLPPATKSNHEMSLSPLIAANTSSSTPSASIVSNTVSSHPGMESFDPSTFNFTSPSSWEALGKMWQVTHGFLPTAEQLMHFVMSTGQASMPAQPTQETSWSSSGQTWRGAGRGRGGITRGGFSNGNARNVQDEWTHNSDNQETDAIVLGETTNSDFIGTGDVQLSSTQNRNTGPGGRMQRIGDKWVFVRDPPTGVSS